MGQADTFHAPVIAMEVPTAPGAVRLRNKAEHTERELCQRKCVPVRKMGY